MAQAEVAIRIEETESYTSLVAALREQKERDERIIALLEEQQKRLAKLEQVIRSIK